MQYKLDPNGNLYQTEIDTHIPQGVSRLARPVHQSSVIFSAKNVARDMAYNAKQKQNVEFWKKQAQAKAQENYRRKANADAAMREKIVKEQAQPPLTHAEQLIKREAIRHAMYGADFSETEEVQGLPFTSRQAVLSAADFKQNRSRNPQYASINVDASGSAAITDWPKRVTGEPFNQAVEPPMNVQLPQSAFRRAQGLGDWFDDVADAIDDAKANLAANALSQTTPVGTSVIAQKALGVPATPPGFVGTMFPGTVRLPVVGPVPTAYLVYAAAGAAAIAGLVVMKKKRAK